jgi:tetratricopeptide (TPR) repeat protein
MRQHSQWMIAAWMLAVACAPGVAFSGETALAPALSNIEQEKQTAEAMKREEREGALKLGADLYKRGEYALSLERLQTVAQSDPNNSEALLFMGLADLRMNDPKQAAVAWGQLQQTTTDPRLAQDVGRMRTILLREVSEREARQAVEQERRLSTEATDPRTVAVATFRNAGTPPYDALGKAMAAMLIDNLSALPGIRVLEREQVQALEAEAKLSGSGLVEKGTAVRAGKLLRAGRVTAGSHTDWTASPTHLKLDAVLVAVDQGQIIGEGKSEALASEFFKLVPEVATTLAAALNAPVGGLGAEQKQKLENPHTHSLDAVLAFGQALDGLDHHDSEAALKACKEVEKADPNFDLAKKKCAFVPLTWLSMDGVATAMEPTAFAMAGVGTGAGTTSYWAPAVAGALVAGGIIGGVVAATSGGGGGGGGGGGTNGNNPPGLTGVGDRTVGAGQTASIDMTCRDPDGTSTTITAGSLPPGGSFNQTSGNPATGRYRQTTNQSEAGQSFAVSFTCTDSGTPPASASASATIRVVQQVPPTPTATPAPTPVPCRPTGDACSSSSQCCGGQCGPSFNSRAAEVCCLGVGQLCNSDNDFCCTGSTSGCDCGPNGDQCCPPPSP